MFSKYIFLSLFLLFFIQSELSSQQFDAEVLKYRSIREVLKDKLIETDSITIQINNRNGDKYSKIEIEYSENEKLLNLDAWIEDLNAKKIRRLNKGDIVVKSSISNSSMYEDHYIKCFELRNNEYPYKVIYTFKRLHSNFLFLAYWIPVIYTCVPTRNAILDVLIPSNLQFKKYENNIFSVHLDSTKKNTILQFKASYNKPIKEEIFSQSDSLLPKVMIAPLYFDYGVKGCTKDWESFGKWQYQLIEGLDQLPEKEKNVISRLIKGVTDKKEIVKILYHYLQDNTRYINVTLGIGGLKPYPASYVAENKYGDCKALTNYMKAILAFAGVESFYTIVYAGEETHSLIKDFAALQFNHVILAVPIGSDTIWLENTSNISPFGYLGSFTQNREALLISKNNSKLVRIPALKREECLILRKCYFDLNINGNTQAVLNFSLKGESFDKFNDLNSNCAAQFKERFIREYIFDDLEIDHWNLKKQNRDSSQIDLVFNNLNLKILNQLEGDYYFNLPQIGVPPFTTPAKRTLPVQLPYPIYKIDSLIYKLPVGYELKTQLDPIQLKSEFGNFKMNLDTIGGKLIIFRKLELYRGYYMISKYHDFFNFIKAIKDYDSNSIIIKPIL